MRTRFDEQLEKLNLMLIDMGALCEEAIKCAVKALDENLDEMRQQTLDTYRAIDEREREIENLCFKLLLQQQPVAGDLRAISSALRMISDMERIGDQAENISEISRNLNREITAIHSENIDNMTSIAVEMVKESIDSFVKKDISLAKSVIIKDDIADDLFDRIRADIINGVASEREAGRYLVDIVMIAKYLERISDHAVNIAQWVLYSITGYHLGEFTGEEERK